MLTGGYSCPACSSSAGVTVLQVDKEYQESHLIKAPNVLVCFREGVEEASPKSPRQNAAKYTPDRTVQHMLVFEWKEQQ
jgi:hypothetical protein